MRAGLAALVVTFLIGLVIGIQSGGEPEVEYKVIHDTETVTETVEVIVPTVPEECVELVAYTRKIAKAGAKFDTTSAALLDIMSRLRILVATGDSNAANPLETELRALDGRTIGAVETIGEVSAYFEDAAAGCLDAS